MGFQIQKDGSDVITANQIRYGGSAVANTIPGDNVAIRGRLISFDTENSISDPRGFIAISGFSITTGLATADASLGFATIK